MELLKNSLEALKNKGLILGNIKNKGFKNIIKLNTFVRKNGKTDK